MRDAGLRPSWDRHTLLRMEEQNQRELGCGFAGAGTRSGPGEVLLPGTVSLPTAPQRQGGRTPRKLTVWFGTDAVVQSPAQLPEGGIWTETLVEPPEPTSPQPGSDGENSLLDSPGPCRKASDGPRWTPAHRGTPRLDAGFGRGVDCLSPTRLQSWSLAPHTLAFPAPLSALCVEIRPSIFL